jgi:protein-export membrane protein SecD
MSLRKHKIALALSLIISFGGLAAILVAGVKPKLGLDLAGGTSVIMRAQGPGANHQDVLQKTVSIIRQRIDSLGVAEPNVTVEGQNNILVELPGVKDTEKAISIIGRTAQLTFRQVLAEYPPGARQQQARQSHQNDKSSQKPGGKAAASPSPSPTPSVPPITKQVGSSVTDQAVVFPSGNPNVAPKGTTFKLAPAVLTGDVIKKAQAVAQQGGSWVVTLDMNDEGAAKWAKFTSRLACLRDKGEQLKSQVAIVLDGKVESAAGMQDPAQVGPGQGVRCGTGITGGATQIDVGGENEAKNLALVLTTGALPVELRQESVSTISPTLGSDSLAAGIKAGVLGLALVFVYVLLYYRTLGLVIWIGLVSFTALIYSILATLGMTAGLSLSLAGVAGVIVSIGITTDSFIVSFERLKDEVRRGRSLRAAVERGMNRAIKTVLVADTVTGIAAVILYYLTVGAVKGFALTLGLSTALDILLTYFLIRPSVHLLARATWLTGGGFMGMRQALGAER